MSTILFALVIALAGVQAAPSYRAEIRKHRADREAEAMGGGACLSGC